MGKRDEPKLRWLPYVWFGLLGAGLGTVCGWSLFQWVLWPNPGSLGWCLAGGAAVGAAIGAWQRQRFFS